MWVQYCQCKMQVCVPCRGPTWSGQIVCKLLSPLPQHQKRHNTLSARAHQAVARLALRTHLPLSKRCL